MAIWNGRKVRHVYIIMGGGFFSEQKRLKIGTLGTNRKMHRVITLNFLGRILKVDGVALFRSPDSNNLYVIE